LSSTPGIILVLAILHGVLAKAARDSTYPLKGAVVAALEAVPLLLALFGCDFLRADFHCGFLSGSD
jgi:hypothetical protein